MILFILEVYLCILSYRICFSMILNYLEFLKCKGFFVLGIWISDILNLSVFGNGYYL